MHVVEILLPLYDNSGVRISAAKFADLRQWMTERFGGITAFTRAPAQGLWKDDAAQMRSDDIVVFEVMTKRLDRVFWAKVRSRLETDLGQKEIVVRAYRASRL